MASYIPAHNDWFGERGVHQGVGLEILFSGRDFDTPDLYSPNDTQQPQKVKSHYACPRAPQRSLHGWGTYSPPTQRTRPSTSSAARPVSLNQCQGNHAHTLPLPRRALAVFRPSVYSSPPGYKNNTVDKSSMLRATIRSRPSDSNQSGEQQSQNQHQSQPFQHQHQQQSRPNQEQEQHQLSLSPKLLYKPCLCPKPVYQPSLSPTPVYRRLTTWQHKDNTNKDNTNTDSNTIKTNNSSHSNSIKRQVGMTSQNVFGQPRVLASLRGLPSPRLTCKTAHLEEELRRLIILDNTSEDSGRDAYCRHSLSTEFSIGSGPLDYSLACSPVSAELEDLSASELSLTEGQDSLDIPLPEPAGSLEWSNLVNAAKAYEAQRTVEPIPPSKPMKHGSEGGPAACPPNDYPPQGYNSQPELRSEVPSDLSDRLHHLEVLLRHLESNLEKERQDKIALMEEVTILRETNQRLWEESLSSNEKLCKLSLLFNVDPGMMPRERE